MRDISPGEEITYDYCLYDGGEDDATCNCGASTCRGTMYSATEIRRRKAAAKKTAKKKQDRGRVRVRPTEIPVPRPPEIEEEENAA